VFYDEVKKGIVQTANEKVSIRRRGLSSSIWYIVRTHDCIDGVVTAEHTVERMNGHVS
jgi:hypothetical protein